LVSGLLLFGYVALHLANHAVGNISVEAMEAGLAVMKAVWQSIPGTLLLYGALVVHMALALKSLYERRMFRNGGAEISQLVLGLLIPLVLLVHISNTRIALAVTGFAKNYAQELYFFWVGSPVGGIEQVLMLLVAWTHGCIGIFFWLRLKPYFRRIALVLLGLAVLWPALALLGFYQGGRVVHALAAQQEWRDAHITALELGTTDEQNRIVWIREGLVGLYLLAIAIVFALRGLRALKERSGGLVQFTYAERKSIRVPRGLSLLEASTRYELPHAGVCGGKGRCGTCLVSVLSGLADCPPPAAAEAEILRKVGARDRPSLRLGCQLRPTGDVTFLPMLPARAGPNFALGGSRRVRPAVRRYVACFHVEMRDVAANEGGISARDLLFLTNRFLNTVSRTVKEAGGQPNRISGNGMLALFGLGNGPEAACRQALDALALVSINLAELNALLAKDGERTLDFVVGLHAGEATLGEIGVTDEPVFSVIGGTARDAAALLDLARVMGCEALLSEEVCARAGLRPGVLDQRQVLLPGGERTMDVRVAAQASMIFGALDTIVEETAANLVQPTHNTRLLPA
jgi:adenylate cyclase